MMAIVATQRPIRTCVHIGPCSDPKPSTNGATTAQHANNREDELWHLANNVIERLAARGYDRDATERAFVAIVERYETGWNFQRRLHLVGGGSEADLGDGDDN